MKITGTNSTILIDLENGYKFRAAGEILLGGKFIVYKNSITTWEPPYDHEIVTTQQLNEIIKNIKAIENQNTVQLIFE